VWHLLSMDAKGVAGQTSHGMGLAETLVCAWSRH